MSALTLVNGELCDRVAASDRGLGYGHGLFETVRVHRGLMPLWTRHVARLVRDAERLHIPLDSLLPHLDGWRDRLLHLAAQGASNGVDGVLKLIVTAGSGERGYGLPSQPVPQAIFLWQSLAVEVSPPAAARLRVCHTRLARQPALAGIKHLNRLEQVMARAEWQTGWDEGLMLDTADCLVEAVSSNLFFHRGGRWYTPDLGQAGVSGVMRSVLLEEAIPACGFAAQVSPKLTVADLRLAEEVFICNALVGLRPVIEVEGVGVWSVGAATDNLRHFLASHYGYPAPC